MKGSIPFKRRQRSNLEGHLSKDDIYNNYLRKNTEQLYIYI